MSIQAIAWVLDYSEANGIDRLVLIALANHANSETGECHPGVRRIAQEAHCAPETVTISIRRLVKLGEVVVTERGQGRATTKYHLPWLSTSERSARPDPRTSNPVVRGSGSVVRGSEPVVRGLDRAEPEPVNRTAHDAAPPADAGDVVAPKIITLSDGSLYDPDTGDVVLVDNGDTTTPARDVIAETRRRLRQERSQ